MCVGIIRHKIYDRMVAVVECPPGIDYDTIIVQWLKSIGIGEHKAECYSISGVSVIMWEDLTRRNQSM